MYSTLPKVFGLLLIVFGLSLVPPAIVALIYGEALTKIYIAMAVAALATGAAAMAAGNSSGNPMRTREGFLVVAIAWFAISALGALPFMLIGDIDPVSALFESASGFTTTGSTAIVNLSQYPLSLLFFRQEIQWLGGIGVVVAAIALLPMLGIGGMQLMKAETTGPAKSDKLRPRIKHTAQALWRIYLFLTVSCALGYWFAGMSVFDAIAHSLTTVSTGGYSIYDDSMGHFQSVAIETIAVIFMLFGAVNFAVHYRVLADRTPSLYLTNPEARTFVLTVAALTIFVALVLHAQSDVELFTSFRLALFEVVSVITSTGYGIDDFSLWPSLLPVFLLFVSFIGGCAGSTAGGMKVIRFLILTKQAVIEVLRLIHPRLMRPLKLGKAVVDDSIVRAVWAFFTIYAFVFVVLMLALMALGLDQVTAFAAVATCLNNLGPGLGDVALNFHSVGDPVKLISAVACILGRLEILTIFVLLTPEFWRR